MIFQGTISSIRFQDPSSGFTVAVLKKDDRQEVAVGSMPGVKLGMDIEVNGEKIKNKYGESIKVATWMEVRPSDIEGIEKYLASGLIRHIGPVYAKKIVQAFGEKTLDVLDNEPERLREIKGIGDKKINSVIESVKEQRTVRSIMIWLKRYGLPNGLAAAIFKTYGENSLHMLEENPYRLADDIKGVGFKKADAAARLVGIPEDSVFRIRSGIIACLEDWAEKGNTYMPENDLVTKVSGPDYLSLSQELIGNTISDPNVMNSIDIVRTDEGDIFLPKYYYAEKKIAAKIHKINDSPIKDNPRLPDFDRIKRVTGLDYSDEQQKAVKTAIFGKFVVITGGPGTGKTATTNAIIKEFEYRGKRVVLTAPTGRAAKRMSEVTNRPAMTIHRLLEYSQGEFTRNEMNPIEGDVIIIDESSMIDTMLMNSLIKAIPPSMHVVMVGDIDQLPSVGAGCILRDIINSRQVDTVMLTKIFRQAQNSDIVMNAHRVNKGYAPEINNFKPGNDFWLFPLEQREDIQQEIVNLVKTKIPNKFGFHDEDIQVLSPMRREGDPIACSTLNKVLQDAMNPDGKVTCRRMNTEYREGDRIMQTKNNYEKDIFNGDIGKVLRKAHPLNDNGEDDGAVMEAEFDGRTIRFTQEELGEIELAYATTIHKSQGSEYPVVIMPIHESHFIMLKRNLLYTGITRAKKQCIIVGTRKAIYTAVYNEDTQKRYTRLTERLIESGQTKAEEIYDKFREAESYNKGIKR